MDVKQRQFLWLLVWSIAFPLVGALLMNGGPGAAASANPPARDKMQTDAGWRLAQPVTYENLTVFPVVSTEEADTSGFATLDDALASGAAIVTEQGSYMRRSRDGIIQPAVSGAQVNQLVLVNRGKRPLLLLAGEVVSGGKQDRIIGKDRIVPIGAEPLPLDVFCVEHGRWTGGDDKFGAAQLMVHPSVREKAAFDQDQSQVWAAVRSGSTASMAETVEVAPSAVGTSSNFRRISFRHDCFERAHRIVSQDLQIFARRSFGRNLRRRNRPPLPSRHHRPEGRARGRRRRSLRKRSRVERCVRVVESLRELLAKVVAQLRGRGARSPRENGKGFARRCARLPASGTRPHPRGV